MATKIMISFELIDKILHNTPKKIAVAVSGGPDSICLVDIVSRWSAARGVKLTALIVEHGLRQESAEEARNVSAFLQSKGVDCKILTWEGKKPKSNIQMTARKARYKLLTEYCKKHGIEHILLGHNANDQAETVMLRIIRGTGVDGISAMAYISKHRGIHIVRPLLGTKRSEIERHIKEIGWPIVNDPSNVNSKYDRVKVRNIFAGYTKEFGDDIIIERLALLAQNARRTRSFIDKEVRDVWRAKVTEGKYHYVVIDNSSYKLHDELKFKLFVKALKYVSGKGLPPKLQSLKHLLAVLQQDKDSIKTLMGCEIHRSKDTTLIFREVIEDNDHILGSRGWKLLKANGVKKPDVPHIKIVYSIPAKWDGDELVSYDI